MLALLLSHITNAQNLVFQELYTCKYTKPLLIDGLDQEEAWQKAVWTNLFTDIEGDKKPMPYLDTRVKMLWDSQYFYFYAEMEEPHIWAKLTQRDAVIFRDNDFEVFIDPDGDTHNYYELEVNAFNTVWDLLLTRPYRDGGHAIDHWDMHGLKTAVKLNGTINDPSDQDQGWSVEIAIPWEVLGEAARQKTPPREGDHWRVNFSRVQWETEVLNGEYVKKKNADTGKNLPENNWVWFPMRAIAMHEPEFWGVVRFTTNDEELTLNNALKYELTAKRLLYEVHRKQRDLRRKKAPYKKNLKALGLEAYQIRGKALQTKISINEAGYLVTVSHPDFRITWAIDQTGRSWKLN